MRRARSMALGRRLLCDAPDGVLHGLADRIYVIDEMISAAAIKCIVTIGHC